MSLLRKHIAIPIHPSIHPSGNENFSFSLENLAWATAQIHCYCSRNTDDKVSESGSSRSQRTSMISGETALNTQQGQGNLVLETEPKILFCDLRLAPSESKSCECFGQIESDREKFCPVNRSFVFRFIPRDSTNGRPIHIPRHEHPIFLQNHDRHTKSGRKSASVAPADPCTDTAHIDKC